MYQILPGIKKIGKVAISNIPNEVVELASSGIPISISTSPTWLCISGTPKVEVKEDFFNNSVYQKGTLTFKTIEVLPKDGIAMVIVDAENKVWLFGQKEVPHISIEHEDSSGLPNNEAAGREYKVKFSAKKVLLPCILT